MAIPGAVPLASKSDFYGLDDVTYLATSSQGPPLKSHDAALARWVQDKSRGSIGTGKAFYATYDRCRATVARLLGVEPEDVAFLGSASEVSNLLCLSLPWQAGDSVVINEVDFPSNVYPWMRLRERGVDVRIARRKGWYIDPEAIADQVDGGTRVVILSQVSWLTGQRHNLEFLARVCHERGARLCVDATHAFGVVDVPARLCDMAFSSSYKWILAGTGVATVFWNRQRWPDFQPATVGWHSVKSNEGDITRGYEWREDAGKLEMGNPPFPSIYVLDNSSRYVEQIGIPAIEAHALALGERVLGILRDLGLEIMTPEEPLQRAGNVCFASVRCVEIARELGAQKIDVVGREGRVRISPHLFNDLGDIERLERGLHELRRRGVL